MDVHPQLVPWNTILTADSLLDRGGNGVFVNAVCVNTLTPTQSQAETYFVALDHIMCMRLHSHMSYKHVALCFAAVITHTHTHTHVCAHTHTYIH